MSAGFCLLKARIKMAMIPFVIMASLSAVAQLRPDIPDGPASFWGLVVNVADIDAACERIGEGRVSPPKDAVQPGRRIATVRGEVGLGLPVALMTS